MIKMTLHQIVLELCRKNNYFTNNVEKQITFARPLIFNFDYPFYSNERRPIFEEKFIKHFLFREICAETPYRWWVYLNETFNLIMPYYNQMFESTLYSFDPFENYFTKTEHKERIKDTTNTKENFTSNLDTKFNETIDKTEKEDNSENTIHTGKQDKTETTQYGKIDTLSGTDTTTKVINTEKERTNDFEHSVDIKSDTPQNNINFGNLSTTSINNFSTQYASEANDRATVRSFKETENANNTDSTKYGKISTLSGTDTVTTTIDNNDTTDKSATIDITGNTITDNTGNEIRKNDTITDKLYKQLRSYSTESRGLQGNYSKQDLLIKLRNTFINVERMIFDDVEVRQLFNFILE